MTTLKISDSSKNDPVFTLISEKFQKIFQITWLAWKYST